MKRTIKTVIIGLLIIGPLSSSAAIIEWTVPAVNMNDGSQYSGSFSWDTDTNLMTDWNFVLSDGTNPSFPAATFNPNTSVGTTSTRFLRFVHNTINIGGPGLELRLGYISADDLDTPVANLPMDSGLDPNPTNLGSFFCYNCSPVLWPTERGFFTSSTVEEPDVFSIVVIPDTQMYAERHPEVFEAQIDWIVANEDDENIIYVAHLGDIKDDGSCDARAAINVGTGGGRSEWQIVSEAIADLDNANIPYGLAVGNHDFEQIPNTSPQGGRCPNWTTERPLDTYNTLFGPDRYIGDAHYGDPGASPPTPGNRVVNSNEDNFTLFESSGVKFIAINLAYKEAANQSGVDPELDWADDLLKTYSDRIGIVTSHFFVWENPERTQPGPKNVLSSYGQEVYDRLSNNQNLFLMMSAHRWGEAWRVENTGRAGMQPVQILLADYQRYFFPFGDGDPNTPFEDPNPALLDFGNLDGSGSFGDSGLMRIMRFDTTTGMVNVETFIPPVMPIKGRPSTLVSTYFPASGDEMDKDTASNFSFSYLGYVVP